jgi:hypothetical protein
MSPDSRILIFEKSRMFGLACLIDAFASISLLMRRIWTCAAARRRLSLLRFCTSSACDGCCDQRHASMQGPLFLSGRRLP